MKVNMVMSHILCNERKFPKCSQNKLVSERASSYGTVSLTRAAAGNAAPQRRHSGDGNDDDEGGGGHTSAPEIPAQPTRPPARPRARRTNILASHILARAQC